MKKTLLFLLSLNTLLAGAVIPSGYYTSAEGKNDAALKTQLSSIISAGYKDPGYDGLYDVYKTSDNLPNGKVWDMYSIKPDGTANYFYTHGSDECGSYSGEGSCYNREHTFCDSWLGEASPQRSDAHHLIPTDGYVNNRRSSFPHGKVGSASWTSSNGSKLGSADASTGYSGTVFEPIDEFKGDFARMYFYVATRYESKIAGWVNNGSADAILAGNTYPAFKPWFYKQMVQWSIQDPVSQKEIDRNDAIYAVQKNRNPYIDHPELVDYIWGSRIGQAWYLNSGTDPVLYSPANASTLDFGNVAYLQTDTASVFIKGANLTGNLNFAITGTAALKFSPAVTSVSSAQATTGFRLVISYNASALETSNAQLTISGGGITSVLVNLTAIATDQFTALAATNISPTGFTANWTSSANATGYSLNVYKLTGTSSEGKTLIDEDFTSGIPSGWTVTGYSDTQTSSNIRMASGSQNCLITAGSVDLSQPTVLTVKSKQYASDTDAKLWVIAGTNDTITSFTNSTNYQTFTYNISQKTATTLNFYAMKGKRVYLDYVKLTTTGLPQTQENVTGYPKSVGNVLSYNVTSLENNMNYYYSVTPEGNAAGTSGVISVHTTLSGNLQLSEENIVWFTNSGMITVKNLPENCQISLIDGLGKVLYKTSSKSQEINLYPKNKGIYLLKVEYQDKTFTDKVIF
jgi:endonuclease I